MPACMGHGESALADAIDFFHMDALRSAVPMNIDVDLQFTLIASTLYRLLATRIGNGLESAKPRTLFRKLVRAGADVTIKADRIIILLPRRTNNPYLHATGYNNAAVPIPWLGAAQPTCMIIFVPNVISSVPNLTRGNSG